VLTQYCTKRATDASLLREAPVSAASVFTFLDHSRHSPLTPWGRGELCGDGPAINHGDFVRFLRYFQAGVKAKYLSADKEQIRNTGVLRSAQNDDVKAD
jgi:hypothetical protein